MSEEPDPPKVGYGSPPVAHRFKKGQSGNRRGRPPKSAKPKLAAPGAVNSIILDEAYRPVSVREGDQVIELPVIQAVVRGLNLAAMKGNRQAQIAVTGMVQVAQAKTQAEKVAFLTAAIDYKQRFELEFARCDQLGIARPQPLPHPDHVEIDMMTGDVRFVGPIDAEDKEAWDTHAQIKHTVQESLDRDRRALKRNPKRRAELEEGIATLEGLCLRLEAYSPDEIARRGPGFDPETALKRLKRR